MVSVRQLALGLNHLMDDEVFYPREAKRFAGYLVLDVPGAPASTEITMRSYRRLESLLFRTTGLQFSPTPACEDLAAQLSKLESLGYVNLVRQGP